LQQCGIEFSFYKGQSLPVAQILTTLGEMDINPLLVEGGGMVFESFYNAAMYDEIYLFMAPHHVARGKALTDTILHSIVSHDTHHEMIGEDRLYHVYRDH
jgi:riboflavin biosynthesis pyrimidine reductase